MLLLAKEEVKHVRATVNDFRGDRTEWAKLGKELNCWQISRLWDRHRGSRNQPDGIHGDRTENSLVARRAVSRASQGEVRCHYLNEGVMILRSRSHLMVELAA